MFVIKHITGLYLSGMRGVDSYHLSKCWDDMCRFAEEEKANGVVESLDQPSKYEVIKITKTKFLKLQR